MNSADLLALTTLIFAIYCIYDYAKLKLLVTGKSLLGSKAEVVNQEELDNKLVAMAKDAVNG